MTQVYTTAALRAASRLCAATVGMPEGKAALAALVSEAFLNGMTAQERLTCDSAPEQGQTFTK